MALSVDIISFSWCIRIADLGFDWALGYSWDWKDVSLDQLIWLLPDRTACGFCGGCAYRGDTILDCCVAPGGKALNLASQFNGQGMNSQLNNGFYKLQVSMIPGRVRWSMQANLQDEHLMNLVGLCSEGCSSTCEWGTSANTHFRPYSLPVVGTRIRWSFHPFSSFFIHFMIVTVSSLISFVGCYQVSYIFVRVL
jgi:hypothetical protein